MITDKEIKDIKIEFEYCFEDKLGPCIYGGDRIPFDIYLDWIKIERDTPEKIKLIYDIFSMPNCGIAGGSSTAPSRNARRPFWRNPIKVPRRSTKRTSPPGENCHVWPSPRCRRTKSWPA